MFYKLSVQDSGFMEGGGEGGRGEGGQQFSILGFKVVHKMILTADFETAVILKSPGPMLAENWMKSNNACPNCDENQ